MLILGIIAFYIVGYWVVVLIGKINGWAMEREFEQHYDSKYGGKGSYKRACKLARQEQRLKQYSR